VPSARVDYAKVTFLQSKFHTVEKCSQICSSSREMRTVRICDKTNSFIACCYDRCRDRTAASQPLAPAAFQPMAIARLSIRTTTPPQPSASCAAQRFRHLPSPSMRYPRRREEIIERNDWRFPTTRRAFTNETLMESRYSFHLACRVSLQPAER
jgi:hypothetical protein